MRPLSDDCNRSWLQSSKSSDVFVTGTKTKMGDQAFQVAGPHTWNSLPATMRKPKTKFPAFKNQLKLCLIGNPEFLPKKHWLMVHGYEIPPMTDTRNFTPRTLYQT